MDDRITYWCYFGNRIVGSHRGPRGMSHDNVRYQVSLTAHIFCDRPQENPTERRNYILRSRVVVYPEGN